MHVCYLTLFRNRLQGIPPALSNPLQILARPNKSHSFVFIMSDNAAAGASNGNADEDRIIKVTSSDGETIEVPYKVIKQSNTIKTMLDDLGMDSDQTSDIPLQNVNGNILKKTIKWCEQHKDDPAPTEDDETKEPRTDDIPSWDAEYLKVDQGTLFELILAANYLDIKGLLDVTCKTVANMIKGKTTEEIRKTFNIKNDFTPEEEEQIRKENAWCED